jgi:hypothetical protein
MSSASEEEAAALARELALDFAREINSHADGFYLPLVQGLRRRGVPQDGEGRFMEAALSALVEGDEHLSAAALRFRAVVDGSLPLAQFHASFADAFAAFMV